MHQNVIPTGYGGQVTGLGKVMGLGQVAGVAGATCRAAGM
jgi:hypothetical protein